MKTLVQQQADDLVTLMRRERHFFAAKLRMTRALIGWSQTELAGKVGLTQRSVHKLEQGDTDPRRATVLVIEQLWRKHGIQFEELADGGFRLEANFALFDRGPADCTEFNLAPRCAAARPNIFGRSWSKRKPELA